MTDAELNRAAFHLITDSGKLVGAILGQLMSTEIETITSSTPNQTAERETAYHRIQAIKDIDASLRNMGATHKATLDNSNPA